MVRATTLRVDWPVYPRCPELITHAKAVIDNDEVVLVQPAPPHFDRFVAHDAR